MVTCPNCDTNIDVDEDELDEGDSITCDECGSTLNVLGTNPLELEAGDDEDEEDEEETDFAGDDDEEEDGDDEEEEKW